jgi:hypothetical protein
MIKIKGFSKYQNFRALPDIIEPFVVSKLRKNNHTFFVYRCSDYVNFKHLLSAHQFDISNFEALVPIVEKYWSAIDAIHFIISATQAPVVNKEYFDRLKVLSTQSKLVIDISFLEIKAITSRKKPDLSVNASKLCAELKVLGKSMRVVKVRLGGELSLVFKEKNLDPSEFRVRTHYGRENKHVGPA